MAYSQEHKHLFLTINFKNCSFSINSTSSNKYKMELLQTKNVGMKKNLTGLRNKVSNLKTFWLGLLLTFFDQTIRF